MPQGGTFGILGFLSHSNDSADMVDPEDRFKFIDDLSLLEIIDLLSIGITTYNFRQHVPSDVPDHNQIIPPENLKSQTWLQKINQWTEDNKGVINEKKTKNMIFNFTDNFQFTSRLTLKGEPVEVIKTTKLLGTIITDEFKWDQNTRNLVIRANARMELLRRAAEFKASTSDLKDIYILFVRSILEQSAPVWHSSLTVENSNDIERVQKSAVKIILGNQFEDYRKSLTKLEMITLEERRHRLCLNFALKCSKDARMKSIFPKNPKSHQMVTRKSEVYYVQHAKTSRLKNSAVPQMQIMLNKHMKNEKVN